jgi:ABC-type nickel/cobalt efflux system permease component RcnA
MIERKAGHITLLILSLVFVGAAIITVMPLEVVYKVNLLGTKTVCPFAPGSTIACVILAALTLFLRQQFFTVRGFSTPRAEMYEPGT